jgi:hypothetical protein
MKETIRVAKLRSIIEARIAENKQPPSKPFDTITGQHLHTIVIEASNLSLLWVLDQLEKEHE